MTNGIECLKSTSSASRAVSAAAELLVLRPTGTLFCQSLPVHRSAWVSRGKTVTGAVKPSWGDGPRLNQENTGRATIAVDPCNISEKN